MDIAIPKKIIDEAVKKGIDIEEVIMDLLVKALNLDPRFAAEARIELALKYLDEGGSLVNEDPIQASEKLYKAAEESVKALTIYFNLTDILSNVKRRGRWTVTELEKAVLKISEKLGIWFMDAWDHAWALHIWGFHETKFDAEDIKPRLPSIEKIVKEAKNTIEKGE